MKRSLIILAVLISAATFAQKEKEIKPSLPKAEKALKENKIDEAKTIIDITTGSQEFMVDKKGQPTKSAPKAWFLKGVIYAAIDTSKNPKFNQLDANAFAVAKESFDKSKTLDGGKTPLFLTDASGFPMPNENVYAYIAQAYFNKAITKYQEDKDFKKAFELTEQTLYFLPGDTSILLNAGVFFAPAAEEDDKAIVYMKEYLAKGGTSPDPYVMMFGIYRDKKKDMESALKIAQEGMAKHPNHPEFPKYELDVLIKTNRLAEAKVAMEKQVSADATDKESRYFLGIINQELKDEATARKWYEEALKLDPKYFEPALAIAEMVYTDAKKVKQEMNQLGITKEDQKKRFALDKVYVEKLKVALPHYEALEKINPDEAKVLDTLLNIYSDLDNQPQVTRIEKKMKTLGLLD